MTKPDHGRYPADLLMADGWRAAAGLAATLGPLALAGWQAQPLVALLLLAAGVPFAALGVRTALRTQTRCRLHEEGLSLRDGFFTLFIRWDQVTGVKLRYYTTRKDRTGGWMQLVIRTAGRRYGIESQLQGFDAVAARLAALVLERGLPVDATTKENFLSLGHYM